MLASEVMNEGKNHLHRNFRKYGKKNRRFWGNIPISLPSHLVYTFSRNIHLILDRFP